MRIQTAASRSASILAVARRGRVWGPVILAVVVAVASLAAVLVLRDDASASAPARGSSSAAGLATTDGGRFQFVPGDQPGIVVTAVGEASAPAESATMQAIVRDIDGFSGGKPSSEGEPAPPPPAPGLPPALTEEQVQPIVDAVVAAGVPAESVEVFVNPQFGGPLGAGGAEVRVELDQTQLELAGDVATAMTEATTQAGLIIENLGAAYAVADCEPLVREAQRAAADDARARAERMAEVLGLQLGEIILASEGSEYGPGGVGCATSPFAELSGKGSYLPAFDPTGEAEVEVYATLNLAYGIT